MSKNNIDNVWEKLHFGHMTFLCCSEEDIKTGQMSPQFCTGGEFRGAIWIPWG